MSRRKQARPIRVLEPEDALQPALTEPAEPGTSILGAINENSCSVSEDDGAESEDLQDADPNSERQCRRCKIDFVNLAAYVAHKPTCVKPVDEEELAGSSGEDADDEKRDGGEVLKRRRLQDAENNNGAVTTPNKEEMEDLSEPHKVANMMNLAPLLNLSSGGGSPNAAAALATLSTLPGAAGLFSSSVTLETMQNTKVAVAQFAATALANCANNPAAMQELAVLQSTLFALQQQQVMQMNIIQQLQQQLTLNRDSKEGSPVSPASIPRSQQDDILTPPSPPISIPSSLPLSSANVPLQPSGYHHERERERVMEKERFMQPSPSSQGTALPATMMSKPLSAGPRISMAEISHTIKPPVKDSPRVPTPPTTSSAPTSIANSIIPPHPLHHQTGGVTGCSISATLADTIITNTEPFPSLDEPNSLEMLQRRAQEVLDSASQGLLAGNLADELAFRGSGGSKGGKNGDGKRGSEPFFKHRCRYCGKVFGSDSALQIHIRSHTARGNTTCNICFKTFACNSALEIHYRSHTKERPFKCTICDRGFSTKGNMKQHMLTHKIRDMPQHLFDTSKKPSSRDRDLVHSSQMLSHGHHPSSLLPQQHHQPPMHLSLQSLQNCSNSNSEDGLEERAPSTPTSDSHISTRSPELGLKRSPPEEDLPMAKRPSGLHKHLCHVCNKNFSSSSALQIHMRTHTGDKPFKCTVCQKAFTTKGNLKVHMGTHMWNNGASRRGRRMSLDLPPIPMTPKDSEFLQRRPDLFYPYLTTPFINGMQQKLNEISVIQSSTPPGGLPSPPSKFGPGLPMGFHGLGQPFDKPLGLTTADASRSPSPEDKSSPLSLVRHASSPPAASAWDMHYRRLSPADRNGSPPSTQQGIMSLSPSPPAGAQNAEAPQHRGESLVA